MKDIQRVLFYADLGLYRHFHLYVHWTDTLILNGKKDIKKEQKTREGF